jgi:hypothetical protein
MVGCWIRLAVFGCPAVPPHGSVVCPSPSPGMATCVRLVVWWSS